MSYHDQADSTALSYADQVRSSESYQRYPVCVSGKRAAPTEGCGGPLAFMERRDEMPCEVWERFCGLKEGVEAGDLDAVLERIESFEAIRERLTPSRFDRRAVNRRLINELGDEQAFFNGWERDWEELPRPDMPLAVGIDGGYVDACEQKGKKVGRAGTTLSTRRPAALRDPWSNFQWGDGSPWRSTRRSPKPDSRARLELWLSINDAGDHVSGGRCCGSRNLALAGCALSRPE